MTPRTGKCKGQENLPGCDYAAKTFAHGGNEILADFCPILRYFPVFSTIFKCAHVCVAVAHAVKEPPILFVQKNRCDEHRTSFSINFPPSFPRSYTSSLTVSLCQIQPIWKQLARRPINCIGHSFWLNGREPSPMRIYAKQITRDAWYWMRLTDPESGNVLWKERVKVMLGRQHSPNSNYYYYHHC